MGKKKEPEAVKILGGKFKDDFCNYSYEVTQGTGIGDTHNVKGKGLYWTGHKEGSRQTPRRNTIASTNKGVGNTAGTYFLELLKP